MNNNPYLPRLAPLPEAGEENHPRPFLMQGGDKWSRPSTGNLPSLARRGGAERRGGCRGKEKDAESALADHGVRKYESSYGRFTGVDPLWEQYAGWTPYHYCRNNPVSFLDFNGYEYYVNNKGEFITDRVIIDEDDQSVFLVTLDNDGNEKKNRIGEFGGKINITEILKNLLAINGKEAERIDNTIDFALMVDTGMPWDLKNSDLISISEMIT